MLQKHKHLIWFDLKRVVSYFDKKNAKIYVMETNGVIFSKKLQTNALN